jgi:hypothetical protein
LNDGASASIPTLHNEEALLMLSINFGPLSGGGTHIWEMACKAFIWEDWMTSHPLPHDLPWKSFTNKLQPGMVWGIVTIVMPPLKVLEQIQ